MSVQVIPEWSYMPKHVQLECVKYLDLKDRMRLRGVSKSDKQLVESAPKCPVKWVDIVFQGPLIAEISFEQPTPRNERNESITVEEFTEKQTHLILHLLRFSKVGKFEFSTSRDDIEGVEASQLRPEFLALREILRTDLGPWNLFPVKTLVLNTPIFPVTEFFLRNTIGVEELILERADLEQGFNIDAFKRLCTAEKVQIRKSKDPEVLCNLVEEWLNQEVPIGQTLHIGIGCKEWKAKMATHNQLQNNVLASTQNGLLLRSNTSANHQFLARYTRIVLRGLWFFVSVVAVPAGPPLDALDETNNDWVMGVVQDIMMRDPERPRCPNAVPTFSFARNNQ